MSSVFLHHQLIIFSDIFMAVSKYSLISLVSQKVLILSYHSSVTIQLSYPFLPTSIPNIFSNLINPLLYFQLISMATILQKWSLGRSPTISSLTNLIDIFLFVLFDLKEFATIPLLTYLTLNFHGNTFYFFFFISFSFYQTSKCCSFLENNFSTSSLQFFKFLHCWSYSFSWFWTLFMYW